MSRLIRRVYYSFSLKWVVTFLSLQVSMLCAQSIQLIWTPNEDPNLSHYGVYRKSHADSSFVLIDTVNHPDSTSIDRNITWNSQYFYAVTAIDREGNESDFSNIGEIATTFPALGRIQDGDQSHPNEVLFSFRGTPGDLAIVYQAYDISTADEVDIFLNGAKIHDEKITGNLAWSNTRALLLTDAMINDAGTNEIRFVNIDNKNNGTQLYWGVRGIRVSQCMPLPHMNGVGRFKPGDDIYLNQACFTFAGQPGDLNLTYEVYDLDHVNELNILLNGTKIHDEAVTTNNSWSNTRSLLLPDALVNDAETNVLIFENTKKPPTDWLWGVRNLSFARNATFAVAVDQSQIVKTYESDGTLQLNFPSMQNLDYLLLYPEENRQHFFSYRIEASLDGQNWQMLVDKSSARAHGVQLDQIPNTQARFLRISGAGYVCDLEQLETAELSEENYWQAVEEMTREAEPGDLAITAIALFRQERLTTTLKEETTLPTTYSLSQNFPNPFNPTTAIEYGIPKGSSVSITIYNISGQEVRRLVDGFKGSGTYKAVWDGKDNNGRGVSSGVYFYQMIAGDFREVKRITFKK